MALSAVFYQSIFFGIFARCIFCFHPLALDGKSLINDTELSFATLNL